MLPELPVSRLSVISTRSWRAGWSLPGSFSSRGTLVARGSGRHRGCNAGGMRRIALSLTIAAFAFIGCTSQNPAATDPSAQPAAALTYYQDAAPIFASRCASCHSPGNIAPFSLLTYTDAMTYASLIKPALVNHLMPPMPPDTTRRLGLPADRRRARHARRRAQQAHRLGRRRLARRRRRDRRAAPPPARRRSARRPPPTTAASTTSRRSRAPTSTAASSSIRR